MLDSVRTIWLPYTDPLEGVVPWPYLDEKGLVTVGIGDLIDPIDQAVGYPWVIRGTGLQATRDQVIAGWERVKARQDLRRYGGGSHVFADLTDLRLTPEGIQQVVNKKLDLNDQILQSRFSGWADLPGDGQLLILSMAWAAGAAVKFPRFQAAVNSSPPDFATAAKECHLLARGNPGLERRNKSDWILANNADIVIVQGMDPSVVYWPQDLSGRPYPFSEDT